MTATLTVVADRRDLAATRAAMPGRVAAVLTMGALHDGHAALIRAARAQADSVLVTLFVNPLQFGPGEDLDRYPRSRDLDLALCAREGVSVIFAPAVDTMYPGGQPEVTVDPGPLGRELEGAARPGHFAGVCTVVAKLLHLTRPEVTMFGEKDYQQLVIVQRMVRDLDLGVEVVGVETVREPDGLALSSRNRYLTRAQRRSAVALSAALQAGAAVAAAGADAAGIRAAASTVLSAEGGVHADYLELRSPDLGPAPGEGPARLLAAVRVGETRLLDNVAVRLQPGAAR